ncbi:hypothetical protein BSKO_10608 [Bryopsis sp. KO-2023]|nr:hypothetical protein BSKO_10608 [Bryopsis sp. KO-2023]
MRISAGVASGSSDASRTFANLNESLLPGLTGSGLQMADQRPLESIRHNAQIETTGTGDGLEYGSSSTRATSTSGSSEDSSKENRNEIPFIPRSPNRPPTRARETLGSRGSYGSRGRNALPPLVRQNAFRQRSPANTRRSRSPRRSNSPPTRSSMSRSSPRFLRLPSRENEMQNGVNDINDEDVELASPPGQDAQDHFEGDASDANPQEIHSKDQPGKDVGAMKDDFVALSRHSSARSVSDKVHKPFSKLEHDVEERLQTLRDNPALRAALEERVREFKSRGKPCNDVESNNKTQCWRTKEEREERRKKNVEQGRHKALRARQKREQQERERLTRIEMDVVKRSLHRENSLKAKKPAAKQSEGKMPRSGELLAFLSLTSKCRRRGAAAQTIQTFIRKTFERRNEHRKTLAVATQTIVTFLKECHRRELIHTLKGRMTAVSDASRTRELAQERMNSIRGQWIAVENRVMEVLKKTSKPQKHHVHSSRRRNSIRGPTLGPPLKDTPGCPSRARVAKARKRLLLLVGSTGSGVTSQTRDAMIAAMEQRVTADNISRIASFWKGKVVGRVEDDTSQPPSLVSLRPTVNTLMKLMEEGVSQEFGAGKNRNILVS